MIKYNYYLKLYDLAKKTRAKHYFEFFLQTPAWSKQELNRYRLSRLRSLLAHAYANCPYYRESFDRAGIAVNDVRSLGDLQYLPVLTREHIQNHLDTLLSANKKQYKCFPGSSSGTAGIPITYYHDGDGFGAGMAALYLSYYLSGWQFGNRSLHIWGNSASIKQWHSWGSRLKQWLFNQDNLDATLLNDRTHYPGIIDMINRFKPLSIDGYTSSIYNLAQYIHETAAEIHRPNIVFTTAENLFPYQLEAIEKELAPVSDIYGCGEINGIAVRPIHTNKYYIMEPHVIVETESYPDSGLHEIIVTDLDNRVMPYIRYKPGDFIDPIQANDVPGNIKYDFFTKVNGRCSDILELRNGRKIAAVTLVGGTALREIPGIMKHKVIWDGDCLHFVFETDAHFNPVLATQKVRESIGAYEHDLKFKIEPVKHILPDKTGKFKYFENRQPVQP
ncbi:MAG TPA: hypothetical protein VK186_02740 [Candidatus Deferrimicrobium sp.]|nr:hypothetical protein [Candidatus Deferrimicrobium sp.]